MKKAQGFTLIELIIVIIILGILAVTAAPKFIDIQSDAKKATLEGVVASIEGAKTMVYAKAALAGIQKTTGNSVTINGSSVDVEYGHPKATKDDLLLVLDISEGANSSAGNFTMTDGTGIVTIKPAVAATATAPANCEIVYTQATSTGTGAAQVITAATVTSDTSGC